MPGGSQVVIGRIAGAFAAFALLLAATSVPRPVGDTHEYVGMSLALLAYGSPSPTPAQLDDLERRLAAHGMPLLRDALHPGGDGRLHHRHFWLYSAIAAPLVAAALVLGASPLWGFTLLNVVLLAFAAAVVARRAGALAGALLFAGPIIWWIDKAHPDAFVFALLAAGFALLDDDPVPALLVWSGAAAQYPPLLLVPVAGGATALWWRPELRLSRRMIAGAAAALAIALVHPAHSLWKLGVLTPLALWGRDPGIPSWKAAAAVYTDLNIGLLVNFPFLVVAVVLWMASLPSASRWALIRQPAGVAALVATLALPLAWAQTVNFNTGATPGVSRYALWLIPLVLPVAMAAGQRQLRPRGMLALVTVSVASCLLWYHPVRPEEYREPTRIAASIWRLAPRLSSPLPEIFSERISGAEPGLLPAATPSCSKVLLLEGRWPAPCAPDPALPEPCRRADALCYANRPAGSAAAYRFRRITDPLPVFEHNVATWPADVEDRIALLLGELRWWQMSGPAAAQDQILRAAAGAGWTTWLAGDGRFFLYASAPGPGATVSLRLPEPMHGAVLAARNGAVLAEVSSPAEPGALWHVPLPPVGEPGTALVLRER